MGHSLFQYIFMSVSIPFYPIPSFTKARELRLYANHHYPIDAVTALVTRGDTIRVGNRLVHYNFFSQQQNKTIEERHMRTRTSNDVKCAVLNGHRYKANVDIEFDDHDPKLCIHCEDPSNPCFIAMHLGPFKAPLHMDYTHHLGTSHREFLIDIDAPDMDKKHLRDWCGCAGKNQVCTECWFIMELYVSYIEHFFPLVDSTLRPKDDEDDVVDPIQSFMWTFSGKKGIHGWAMNPKLTGLTPSDCKIAYNLLVGMFAYNLANTTDVTLLFKYFLKRVCIPGVRDLFANAMFRENVVTVIEGDANDEGPHSNLLALVGNIREAWARSSNTPIPRVHFEIFTKLVWGYPEAMKRVVIHYMVPWIDEEVTIRPDFHLLKIPFSVHKENGYIDLPLHTVELSPGELIPRVSIKDLVQDEVPPATKWRMDMGLHVFGQWLVRQECLVTNPYKCPILSFLQRTADLSSSDMSSSSDSDDD